MPSHDKTIVYAAGVWDLFHVGHLNLLKAAKALGDVLIVGVSTDDLVLRHKGRRPVVGYEDRAAIVGACRYVDLVVCQETIEKDEQLERLNVDVLVVGSDWWGRKVRGHEWITKRGGKVFYFPYTQGRSSTAIREHLLNEPGRSQLGSSINRSSDTAMVRSSAGDGGTKE